MPPADKSIPRVKNCTKCGREYHRNPKYSNAQWLEQIICSTKCPKLTPWRWMKKRTHKKCNLCGTKFRPRSNQNESSWDKQLTCSPECANAVRAVADVGYQPHCLECGKELERAPTKSDSEFFSKKFCSKKHAAVYNKRMVRMNSVMSLGSKPCLTCGATMTLQENQKPYQFRKLKYCPDCSRFAAAQTRIRNNMERRLCKNPPS